MNSLNYENVGKFLSNFMIPVLLVILLIILILIAIRIFRILFDFIPVGRKVGDSVDLLNETLEKIQIPLDSIGRTSKAIDDISLKAAKTLMEIKSKLINNKTR